MIVKTLACVLQAAVVTPHHRALQRCYYVVRLLTFILILKDKGNAIVQNRVNFQQPSFVPPARHQVEKSTGRYIQSMQ